MTNLKIHLEFTTVDGIKTLDYKLANNPIAHRWIRKIYHLQKVPVDRLTTSNSMTLLSYGAYKEKLDSVIKWINVHTHLYIEKKEIYNQDELCKLHDHYLDLMKNSNFDYKHQVHEFNTLIHHCEFALHNTPLNFFKISWGQNEGLLMEKFQQSPYTYYTEQIVPGNLYLFWAEQGKTPGDYYFSKDPDNLENFLKTTAPHQQFSGLFTLQIGPKHTCSHDFWKWFEKYKQPFLDHWQLDNWTSLHQDGAIELATLLSSQEHLFDVKKQFRKFERIYLTDE